MKRIKHKKESIRFTIFIYICTLIFTVRLEYDFQRDCVGIKVHK